MGDDGKVVVRARGGGASAGRAGGAAGSAAIDEADVMEVHPDYS